VSAMLGKLLRAWLHHLCGGEAEALPCGHLYHLHEKLISTDLRVEAPDPVHAEARLVFEFTHILTGVLIQLTQGLRSPLAVPPPLLSVLSRQMGSNQSLPEVWALPQKNISQGSRWQTHESAKRSIGECL
jgi:hypothetical protein